MPLPSSQIRALLVRSLLALASIGAGACRAGDPVVNTPPDKPIRMVPVFADVVLQITTQTAQGSDTIACTENGGIPICGETPAAGPCDDNAVLGPPSATPSYYDVGPGGIIDFGFLCDFILEVGPDIDPVTKEAIPSDDFRLYGVVEDGARPIVEVSLDGTTYYAVNIWPQDPPDSGSYVTNPGFQLEYARLVQARFVRVTNTVNQGRIRVDAIEAFPPVEAQ